MSDWRVVSDHGWPCREKIFPQDIISLTALMFEVALNLSNSSVIIANCFQPFGWLLSASLLDVLWKLAVSVFCLCGYILPPRQTRLGVRMNERLAMLASIVHTVYSDNAWVAVEYLRRCKAWAWKKENTVEAVTCWNLERILDVEQRGQPMPEELTMDDLVREDMICSK